MSDGTWRPAAKPTVVDVEVDGERVLLDEATGRLHLLDRVAAVIWTVLDGSATVDELVVDLADAFGTPAERVRADLDELLESLSEAGLLVGTGDDAGDTEPGEGPARPRFLVDPPSG